MKKLILLFLFTISATAQIKGVVKDSITKEPIAYAAIVDVINSTGTNSNEKGEFELSTKESNSKITVSCLGYESKVISISGFNEILLKPKDETIQSVIISNKKMTSEIVVGEYKNSKMGFSNGGSNHVWAKYIKFSDKVKKHPFIKEIEFTTRSRVKNAKLKLRFYNADSLGKPNGDLIYDEIIITVKKGKNNNNINLEKYNILIPKEGIFIGFENLIIEENKFEFIYTSDGEKGKFKGVRYEPIIQGFNAEEYNVWVIKNEKGFLFNSKFKENSKPFELGIKITLTN